MPRQLVRLSEVRSPLVTDDSYSPAQIQDAEKNSRTTQDFLQYVLSQIRLIQGTQSWKQAPVTDLVQVSDGMAAMQADMAAMARLAAQVAALAQQLAAAEANAATQTALAQTNAALAALSTQTQARLQALAAALAAKGAAQVFDRPLTGAQNRLNRVFLAPEIYAPQTLRVYLNGQRLCQGSQDDYAAAESRPGQGFDQVVLSSAQAAPIPQDQLTADYTPA